MSEQASSAGTRERTRAAQRDAIERAALRLLDEEGPGAVTSRAVSAEAGVQPMTIYRIFGDMDQLLDAAAGRGFADYLQRKRSRPRATDPVDDLRHGWDLHVGYGLEHPHVYAHTYGRFVDASTVPAMGAAAEILRGLVARAEAAGRLVVDAATAAHVIHAAGCGTTFALMQVPADERDLSVSTTAREAVLAAITTGGGESPSGAGSYASALRHALPTRDDRFTDAELALLKEWLGRLSD